MMGRNHIASGVGVVGIAVGGSRYLCRRYALAESVLAPVLDRVRAFFWPSDRVFVLKALMLVVCCVVYLVGVLGPDMDKKESMIGRYVYIPVKHRTVLHSIWPVIPCAIAGCLNWYLRPLAVFGLGWFVHLLCDKASYSGVWFFWPVRLGPHVVRLYVTETLSEYILAGVIVMLGVLSVFAGFWMR